MAPGRHAVWTSPSPYDVTIWRMRKCTAKKLNAGKGGVCWKGRQRRFIAAKCSRIILWQCCVPYIAVGQRREGEPSLSCGRKEDSAECVRIVRVVVLEE